MDAHQLLHGECTDAECSINALWSQMREHLVGERRVEMEGPDDLLQRRIHMAIEPIQRSELDDTGDRPFALIIVRDVTEVHREKVLEGRKTRFEALHLVVRSLAHELGNPLAALRATVEVLTDNIHRFEPAKIDTYLERLLAGTERLQLIVDRSLREQEFARLTLRRIPLSLLLERTRDLFADDMAARQITFEVSPLKTGELWLLGDLTAIEEVLGNLVRNAMEATSQGGTISLGHSREAEKILLIVRDNGRGMDELQLGQVFQPFFTTNASSMGIGLAFVHHLITKMGGTIKVDSQVGQGTEVTLELVRWPAIEPVSLAASSS